MPESTNRESNEGIDSRVEIKNHIMEALRNPRFNMIGLCGLGGVGKTTIAKDIEKEEENQKVFVNVIMATVSREMNIGKIQDQIIDKLGMQLKERSVEGKASRLYKRLENEKNMLLILDDLWQELDLGKVGIPFGDVERYSKINEGCKILLTSRNKTLLSDLMKCQKTVEVGVLSEDEALKLFKKIAELSPDSSNPEFISKALIALDIVQKCGGLPLAIATTAKALRKKDINDWKDALARLNNPFRRNNTLTREVDTILTLSFDYLNSSEYKQIFLLSAMLSHDLSIEDLLMYSVGLDILDGIENMKDARVGVSAIVRKLKSVNLFLDSISSHHVTIHDVFRDVALPIASKELHSFIRRRLKEWPDENMLEDCKGICLRESDISDLPEGLHCRRLQFFLLDSTKRDLSIPSMFFESSKELKLLAFTNMHFSSLSFLIFLHKLKALCLHSCLLEDIAEVKSLKNLKVLSLVYSEIQRLPIELAGLTSLQMLNLSHCSNLKVIPQKLLSSFKKLEVLYMGDSFHQWKVEGCSETSENASLDELMGLPISSLDIHIPNASMLPEKLFSDMNLERYKIFIREDWEWQDTYETSKILKLHLQSSIHLKGGFQKLLEGVEDFYLYGSNAHENVLHSHEGREFPHLRYLHIYGNDEAPTKNVYNKTFKSFFNKKMLFPKLGILELFNLNNSIALIWDDQLSHNNFSNLKTFKVKRCGFVKLVPLYVLKSLNNLEELDVRDCDMLEIVFYLKDDKEIESSSVVVPLKKLKLQHLPKLKNVFSNNCQGNRHAVTADLCIKDGATNNTSNEISKSLFNKKVLFSNLEEVEVENCDMLEIVFDFEDLNDYYKEGDSSSVVMPLKTLKLWGLPKLKNVWSNNYQGNISFPSLRSIRVSICESLTSIFPAFPALQFPRLTSLELYWLPQLTSFYPQRHTLEWPHLQRLYIERCDGLEIFEKEVSSEIYEEESTLNSKYPLFSHHKVIQNLEELVLHGKPAKMIGSGQSSIYHFPKVKQLSLHAREADDNATTILYITLLKSFPNLEELQLSGDFGQAFGGDDIAALASPFPKLILYHITITRSLSPLLVSSPNLTHIEVTSCYDLTTLMTSSTARSLVHLTHLTIGCCAKMKEIITKQEGENDEDKEIVFDKLKILVLDDLRGLKRFCGYNYTIRFPLLDQLVITECPSFKIFSTGLIDTPFLKSIQLSQDGEKQHQVCDADLNKTFYQQRLMVSTEVVLDEVDAIMIRNDQFPADHCPQVEILGIEGFVDEWVTFPYTLLERFPKLNALHVENCSFEEIFPSHAPSSTAFHNLTALKVSKCHHLVYLVTCSAVKSLVNLETLEIDECEKLEEIVRNETDEDVERGITFNGLRILKLTRLPKLKTQEDKKDFDIEDRTTNTRCTNISRSLFSQNKVLLPKLETLELSNLLNNLLSLIWDDQHLHNSFSNLKTLIVKSCDFMKLVPFHVLKSLNNLDKLEVSDCDKLEMVFGFEDLNDYHKEMELSSVVAPLSLTHLEVKGCHGLTTLMTSSAPPSLVHITHLSIRNCNQIEEIIMKQEGEDNEDKEIFFNQMKFMELDDLPRLKRFCGYNYTFRFPLLEDVTITKCPQLTIFCPGAIHAPRLQSVRVSKYDCDKDIWMTDLNNTIKHLFTFEEVISTTRSMALNGKNIEIVKGVFPKVLDLYVASFTDEGTTFPYSSLKRFPQCYRLYVEHCSFEKIFPSQDQIIDFMGKIPQFCQLHIAYLDKLKSIWKDDSQLPLMHQKLIVLDVKSCCSLVKLVPSSASFQNLRELYVSGCHRLILLVTTSTAKSFVSLSQLEINDCKKMEEIVMNDANEDVESGITFNKLWKIKLTNMPSLKMFSSQSHAFEFRKLKEIEITGCPEIKMFCRGELKTPKLSKLKIEEYAMEWKDEGDLNKTMEGLSSAKDSINI